MEWCRIAYWPAIGKMEAPTVTTYVGSMLPALLCETILIVSLFTMSVTRFRLHNYSAWMHGRIIIVYGKGHVTMSSHVHAALDAATFVK